MKKAFRIVAWILIPIIVLAGIVVYFGAIYVSEQNAAARPACEQPTESAGGVTPVTVLSYNIRCFVPAADAVDRWSNRKDSVFGLIEAVNPDIFGVQELTMFQVSAFVDRFRDRYTLVGEARDGIGLGERSAIFFSTDRFRLLEYGTAWLSETPARPSIGWDASCNRVVTHVVLQDKTTGVIFAHYNTHFDHIGKVAQQQSGKLIADLIAASEYPALLTGDFNVPEGGEVYQGLTKYFRDAKEVALQSSEAPTYQGYGKKSEVIDFVFLSGAVTAQSYRVIDRFNGIYPSDHSALVVEALIGA